MGEDHWNPYLKNLLERIPEWSGEGAGNSNNYLSVIPDHINYVHVTLNFGSAAADFTWNRVNEWRAGHPDGLTVLTAHNVGGVPYLNLATSPLNSDSEGNEYSALYPNAVYGNTDPSGDAHWLRTASSNTKVYQYVMQHAVNKLETGHLARKGFYSDANNLSSIPVAGLPTSAVPMLHHANGRSTLIIDPERHLVYFGETEHFQNDRLDENRSLFLQNVVKYMENAAKYGTHFTDLLIESGPDAQPAPWDSYWGDNALE